jgi:hypothetical protein
MGLTVGHANPRIPVIASTHTVIMASNCEAGTIEGLKASLSSTTLSASHALKIGSKEWRFLEASNRIPPRVTNLSRFGFRRGGWVIAFSADQVQKVARRKSATVLTKVIREDKLIDG